MSDRRPVSVYLTADEFRALAALAEREGRSLSNTLRRALLAGSRCPRCGLQLGGGEVR